MQSLAERNLVTTKQRLTRSQTFAIYTLGCKANQYDSECIRASMISDNYIQRSFNETNDIYIINTCAVTNKSTAKSRQIIRRAFKTNQKALICVVGCYSQLAAEEVQKLPGVQIVMGTENKFKIAEIITSHRNNLINNVKGVYHNKRLMDQLLFQNYHEKLPPINKFGSQTRAFIKIQDGCNNFCTFCIIPYTRGRLRSRIAEDIIAEINQLTNVGYQEIVLTGIHTAGYGEDLPGYNFYQLLNEIRINCQQLKRLRISSIEISQISVEIQRLLTTYPNFYMPHLHVPIQAGSDNILQKMERKYNLSEYIDIVKKLKQSIPNIAITTDIIIGFPTETNAEFEKSMAVCQKIGFSELHVFPYSPRTGTPAASMPQVNDFVKKMRVTAFLELNKQLALKFITEQQKTIQHVLFETKRKGNQNEYIGYSQNYIRIMVNSKKDITNKILPVRIVTPNYPITFGALLNN